MCHWPLGHRRRPSDRVLCWQILTSQFPSCNSGPFLTVDVTPAHIHIISTSALIHCSSPLANGYSSRSRVYPARPIEWILVACNLDVRPPISIPSKIAPHSIFYPASISVPRKPTRSSLTIRFRVGSLTSSCVFWYCCSWNVRCLYLFVFS